MLPQGRSVRYDIELGCVVAKRDVAPSRSFCARIPASGKKYLQRVLAKRMIPQLNRKMKHSLICLSFVMLTACASAPAYGPADRAGAYGYTSQKIEDNRFSVSYTDTDPAVARDRALVRAAEVALENGADWFQITGGYSDIEGLNSGGTSVGIGGATGSRGHSSMGVGVGISLPLGGSQRYVESLEIITGSGDKPSDPNAYDARSVILNLKGAPT